MLVSPLNGLPVPCFRLDLCLPRRLLRLDSSEPLPDQLHASLGAGLEVHTWSRLPQGASSIR